MVSASARLAAGDTMAAGAWKAVEAKLMALESLPNALDKVRLALQNVILVPKTLGR